LATTGCGISKKNTKKQINTATTKQKQHRKKIAKLLPNTFFKTL
jgi:hypothetical protein